MIKGVHAMFYSEKADELRDFIKDKLKLPYTDVGGGWLIFALPPAEVAVHPAEQDSRLRQGLPGTELYLMCDDVAATVTALRAKGFEAARPVSDQGWGLLTAITLPGGVELGLYQPRHPTALPSP